MIRRCRLLVAFAAVALLPLLGACATAPATGRTIFTGGMTEQQEAQLGFQEHEKILKEFGGAYQDPALDAYVASIGKLLARTSEMPDLPFTFTVLDTPMVNAFALPGGYVYITRGLLALAGNEAEVAGVLAHEIGHVTARHAAERYGQTMAATLLNVGAGVLLGGGPETQALGQLSTIVLRGFSRDQEYEADVLGVRYMARSGHDTQAMASFLDKLLRHSRLEAELAGRPGRPDEFDIMQTHPRTADRIGRAIAEAGTKVVGDPIMARDIYLAKIEGMLYGDNPDQGFIRGRAFAHPRLGFTFEVPDGFRLFNSSSRVTARGPEGSVILFDRARKPSRAAMVDYLTREWVRSRRLRDVETLSINGMEAATGQARVDTRRGPVDVRLVAIRYDGETIYRLVFVTPAALTGGLGQGLRQTTYSFRRLSAAEAAALRPLRLRLHRVRPGESAATIARRMPFEDFQLQRFLVLNGLDEGVALKAGETVKIVAE